ncbi:MAG: leucine-rich repeat protein [Clostridiales bacterium]|nr:leucine-rich repeat protein [Clostridiales bacterium]
MKIKGNGINKIKRLVALAAALMLCAAQFSVCAFSETSSVSDFTYEIISGSSEVRITGYEGTAEDVVIPDTINGRTVSEIGASAFSGNEIIETLEISSNIKRILSDAFSGCTALAEVSIPASVTSIGDSAFKDCTSLSSLTINSPSTVIGNYSFENCVSLTSVAVPSSKIGYAAFRNCSSLSNISLSESVQSVGRYAFSGTSWYDNAEPGLLTLAGVVYAYTGSDADVVIPDGVTCIADYAFAYSDAETVVIPDGVYYIGNQAFFACENLTYLSVPSSVISIGTKAFGYSDSGMYEDFLIYCYDNSTAQTWAVSNGIKTELIDNCSHEYTDWIVGVSPDCTNDGYEYRRCIKCNITETQITEALGHTWSEWELVSEYSCTEDEVSVRTCAVCGEQEYDITETTGHVWGEWIVSKTPDCTNEGERYHTCTVCGTKETESIAAVGHKWTVDDTTDSEGWKILQDADCTNSGAKIRVCSVCGYAATSIVAALGHMAGEWTVLKEATALEDGLRQSVCTVCGETFTEVIPASSEDLPDNVKMLSLNEGSSLSFNSERTCVLGIYPGTTVGQVISEFEYSDYILAVSLDSENQSVEIVNSDENAATGLFMFLIDYSSDTEEYTYIDTMCLVVKGDLDGSGTVTVSDARLALRASAGLETLGSVYGLAGDLDGSGTITTSEARTLLRVAAKLESLTDDNSEPVSEEDSSVSA